MSRCNLSFSQLKNYLNLALKKELVIVEKTEFYTSFKISNKGKAFLETYESLEVLMA